MIGGQDIWSSQCRNKERKKRYILFWFIKSHTPTYTRFLYYQLIFIYYKFITDNLFYFQDHISHISHEYPLTDLIV